MRKWKSLASRNDPNVWADVGVMWPTRFGTYEVADFWDSGTAKTATGEPGTAGYAYAAWAFNTLASQRCYVFGKKIWEYAAGALTDRSGALGVNQAAAGGHACQYGDITIVARGTSASLISSSGANFAAIAGSPSALLVCVQSNAVVAFNTSVSADGWAASDVGDYTNWTTNEAASGRILDGNGPITACVPFGNDIIVFKADRIFRMTYVGGTVKWQIQKIVEGIGCALYGTLQGLNAAVACGSSGIFFLGGNIGGFSSAYKDQYFMFDGASPPRPVNADVTLNSSIGIGGISSYDPETRMVMVVDYNASECRPYFYNVDMDAWGKGATLSGFDATKRPVPTRGDQSAINAIFTTNSALRPLWYEVAADAIKLYATVTPGGSTASTAYVTPTRVGSPAYKTDFNRVIPLLRRRSGTTSPSMTCGIAMYRELHDTSTSATQVVTESTQRARFDFLLTDNFAAPQLNFINLDVEIDDLMVIGNKAGTD